MSDELLSDVTYETLPLLASNPEFAQKADRLRHLKQIKDEVFTDKKDKNGVPIGEWDRLRIECGAMVAVAGVKSVVYQDLRISNTEPSATGTPGSGSIDATAFAALMQDEVASGDTKADEDTIALLLRIIAAARGFDEERLLEAGVPPHVIARSRGIGKGRAGSTRIEWVGKKGRGAGAKQGTGGPVQ